MRIASSLLARVRSRVAAVIGVVACFGLGCSANVETDSENPFLEEPGAPGRSDTGYVNPDGVEVEVDLEADVQASSYSITRAPALLGQYALTYLRERGQFYLESLAEQASAQDRVEWLVDGNWIPSMEAQTLDPTKLTHFRIRGVNAVLLHDASRGVSEGSTFTAEVPLRPYDVYSQAGDKCANQDGHLELSSSLYWYLWNPDRSECNVMTEEMTVTVSRMLPVADVVYPEYDRLLEDGKITAVVLFGQIDDNAGPNETGVRNSERMARSLLAARFTEVSSAPVGRRFSKEIGGNVLEIDLYAPSDFSGLSDHAHFGNFQRAISEHEIVAYDGHSMLGASDFWARPTYPQNYQMFLYGGCLGYEYYVQPILEGKGGWENLDLLSSVIEVTADANYYAAPILAKIAFGMESGTMPSWNELLAIVRDRVGDSTFGISGARDNCYSPSGSVCTPTPTDSMMP